MDQKTLAKWLKCIIAGIALCGVAVCTWIIPSLGKSIAMANPEFAYCYRPWLAFIWITAIPCFGVVALAWKIVSGIEQDRSFTDENARLLKWISLFAAGNSAFFFAGNVIFLFLNMNHPGILLGSLVVVFAGVAVSVAAAVLSRLVKKAADLQEQSDLTI